MGDAREASGEEKHGKIVSHLKEKHGLGHGFANLVAHTHLKSGSISAESTDALVDAQYAGAKAPMRAWYDALAKKVSAFGSDRLAHGHRDRVQGSVRCRAARGGGGLEHDGDPPVRVKSASGIDAELVSWLRKAYDTA